MGLAGKGCILAAQAANHNAGLSRALCQNRTMEALHFESVGKSWHNSAALSGITFGVPQGACFGLVGANGAGKTTLLKCLLDFCEPDEGNITLFGVTHRDTAARTRVAYLPERFNPPHYLTGRDFLQFMARMHRAGYNETDAAQVLQSLDLATAALDKPVRTYSKGMNQKLGLAACMLSGKDLYILDEPTSGLDPRARILLKRTLKALRDSGKTIFFTSHALADVEEMCDRVAVIDDGKLCFAGTPAELMRSQGAGTMEAAFMALVAHDTCAA